MFHFFEQKSNMSRMPNNYSTEKSAIYLSSYCLICMEYLDIESNSYGYRSCGHVCICCSCFESHLKKPSKFSVNTVFMKKCMVCGQVNDSEIPDGILLDPWENLVWYIDFEYEMLN